MVRARQFRAATNGACGMSVERFLDEFDRVTTDDVALNIEIVRRMREMVDDGDSASNSLDSEL
jgi:hypothetical protein